MRADRARAAALDWVRAEGRAREGYVGAYVTGSTVGLRDEDEVPVGSDLDLTVVTRAMPRGPKPGKFPHLGVLFDVTVVGWDALAPAGHALADYHLAAGLSRDTVLDDPTGGLRALQRSVAREFAAPARVRQRCGAVLTRIEAGLRTPDTAAPWPVRVTGWLFPTCVSAHLPLVAGLRNPTVRLRHLRARELLTAAGLGEHYPALLAQLDPAGLTPERVGHHVECLAVLFDATAAVAHTPFPFSSDLTPAARPVAVDASRALVRAGDHREALFWVVATAARCHTALLADAPDLAARHAPQFAELLADLGINDGRDLAARSRATLAYLPELAALGEEIIAAGR
ncbi:hypothetical protein [Streptomyces fuscigenes]|uniref:hypothetical protein n=1 Tax=Streptomyces fuscigenes TaxID=1528880 RepID=UPI001F3829D6|nr:hypothetical protein [Streptomyces fuscigenes]MCF3962077.1 hypothetical protein [Streptomyces fuscigenes]